MTFPFGGFKTPEKKQTGRYSGAERDFAAEMRYDEGDGDVPYGSHLDTLDNDEKVKEYDACWNERITVKEDLFRELHLEFHPVAQSHMDIAWLWRLWQIINKAKITCGKAAFHVLNVPGFKFTFSQPVMLEWLRLAMPDVFDRVKRAVKTGRFDLQGGDWVEADGKLPSGESFCRQRLYGQRWYLEHFGRMAEVGWLPDSFGYNNNIPQFLNKSGCKYFYTQKISGNWPPVEFPFAHFKWRSPDGSEVIVYSNNFQFRPVTRWNLFGHTRRILKPGKSLTCDYNTVDPKASPALGEAWSHVGIMFGQGDGGHGPTVDEVNRMRHFVNKGYVGRFLTGLEYFKLYDEIADRLPVWDRAELYYNLHRGTLTTQGLMKRMNRYFEWRLNGLQSMLAFKTFATCGGCESHHGTFTRLWKDTLLLQFHDILPGSSIPEVYDDCYDIWTDTVVDVRVLESELLGIPGKARKPRKGTVPRALVYYNASDYRGVVPVEIPVPGGVVLGDDLVIEGKDGAPIDFQVVEPEDLDDPLIDRPRRLLFCIAAEPWSTGALQFASRGDDGGKPSLRVKDLKGSIKMESKHASVSISKRDGAVTSFKSKDTGDEIFSAPATLAFYRDWAMQERAWNLGPGYHECQLEPDEVEFKGIRVVEHGPVRCTVEVEHALPESGTTFQTRIQLYRDLPGVYFEIVVDWNQEDTVAKHSFSFHDVGKHVIAEGPYTTEIYKADPAARTRLDAERWESCCHTWLAIPSKDGTRGVFYINNSKYGFDVNNNAMGITLLRGPDYPPATGYAAEERALRKDGGPPTHVDKGKHVIRHALIPFAGSWKQGTLQKYAHCFNTMPAGRLLFGKSTGVGPFSSRITLSHPNLELVSMKKSEDEPLDPDEIVLRIVETCREAVKGTVIFPKELCVQDVKYLDLVEHVAMKWLKIKKEDGTIVSVSADWKPHEVLTFKVMKKSWIKCKG
ncbi:MAG: glycoside hydrolase family 38 C-terminal domain-containing protein [Promethearchaeota archaeon]